MEDYEKKYKEALATAKDCLKDGTITSTAIDYISTIFPELKESEDEWIRKELIRETKGSEERLFEIVTNDEFVSWLEKQGESYTKKDVDDAYLKGIFDTKQGKQDARYLYLEEIIAADDIYRMSMNDAMVNEAKEKAAKALSKLGIGKLLGFEKQGEQKPAAWSDEDEENLQHCCMAISVDSLHTYEDKQEMEAWLKSLKQRIGG